MSARGGQAIPSLDYALAPYVAKSYVRNCVGFLKDLDLIPDTVDIKKNFIHYFDDEITKDIEKPVEQNYSIMDHLNEIDSKLNDLIDISPKQLAHMHKVASRRTTEETEQSLEAMVHNLCSMNCLAPDQEFWVYDTAVHQWVIYNAETFSRVFVPGRFYAFSLNNLTGDSEIKPITGAWATFNDKPMVKVTDKSGASFVTTFDHRYLTVTDDCSFDYVQAQNLKYTVHPRNFNLFSEVNYIAEDVSQHVRRNECTIRYKKDYVPYSLALAEFIGYYVGDGYITPDDSTIDFACAEKVYPEHLLDLCEEAFGFVPKYSIHVGENSLGQNSAKHMVIFLGVKLNRMIRKLAGTGAANKHVPNFVLHGSWQMQDAFLHGYLMCDGSRKGRNYIEFTTISKPLIDDMRMMFASRGELLHTHLLPARECQQALWTGILGSGAARRLHLQYLVNGANTSFEIPRYNTSHITSKLKEAKIPWGPLPRVPRRENGAIRYEELPQIEMDDALRDTLNPFTKCFKVDVVNIEQAPDCPVVYDIEVADNANFLTASGFIVHNSRAGSQTPFSSVNVGLSTTWEGRTVTHSLLKAVEAGLGLGETAIFPISIFKMKKGVTDKGSPNYDLFQYACKVSAKRLYPNFLSIDAPFNLIHYRKDRPEYQASAMGCVHGTETSLWKLDDEIYVSDFGRMSRILMNKYPLIQYSEISHYMDLEKADIGIWDSFNNKFAKVKKFIINKNVNNWRRIRFNNGRSLIATGDHPLPVEGRGRISVDELREGDKIRTTSSYPLLDKISETSRIDYYWLLGMILCDGGFNHNGVVVSVGADETELKDEIVRCSQSMVNTSSVPNITAKLQERGVKGRYYDVAIYGVPDEIKQIKNEFGSALKIFRHVPNSVFNQTTRAEKVAFLAGMIDADGYVNDGHRNAIVQIGSVNKILAYGQAILAEMLGCHSKIYLNHYRSTSETEDIRYRVEFFASEELMHALRCNKKRNRNSNYDGKTVDDEYCSVQSVEKIILNEHANSYDVETDTDRFDVGMVRVHNCRTRVLENKVDPQHAITEGRGNLFWTTINFPLIALDAKREAGVTNPIPIFMNKLHEIVNSVIQYSLDRFKVVAKRKAKNYPFMMGQHEYVGSEKLLPNDDIESVIKEGTMAVGFIGLSETLVALIGKHHGESEEAQELGLTILNTMKKWVDEASEKYGYNFGVMASPAEGCTGRLLRITRKKYGVIKGITDKEYFTNSFHICPTYKISAWKKVQLEAPYHAICTSGAISYVELDTDTVRNPQAFEELVNFMADSGCGYFAINHPMTRDPVCGYVGPLRPDGSCPRCGRKEFEGVAVNKLLSLTSYSPDPEYDVRLHENEDTTSNTL